jgi:hypothetical protein
VKPGNIVNEEFDREYMEKWGIILDVEPPPKGAV